MMRLERLEHLAEKFRRKCALYEEWAYGKEDALRSADWRSCGLYKIKALRKRHEAFESDLGAHQDRVEQIAAIARELNNLRYPDIGPINARCQAVCDQWDRLGSLSQQRRRQLEEAEQVAERLDRLYLDFAKRAAPFNNWLDGAREDLADTVIVHEMKEVQELLDAHNRFKSTISDADSEFRAIVGIEQVGTNPLRNSTNPKFCRYSEKWGWEYLRVISEIGQLIEQHGLDRELLRNPYTDLSGADIRRKWQEVQHSIPKRDAQLQNEYHRQQNNERLRQLFAEKANTVGPWLERQLEQVLAIGLGGRGSLESAVSQLKSIQQQTFNYKPNLEELERINQEMQENYVFENRAARYSMESLRVGWESLLTSVNRTINECENQGDQDMGRILSVLDPNRMGRIPFDAFLDFMTRETADADTAEQMIESFRILSAGKECAEHTTTDKRVGLILSVENLATVLTIVNRALFFFQPYITADEIRRELPADQAEYCIERMHRYQAVNAPPGSYDYVSFSKSLYSH
ncbi:unnamed protein product [Gongylonema pulchrum]|uniref:EF-hand domain-containing protein n=1 Tax=Gongylonema pulchrum TaxID=637853 RepID=A0A183ELD9_9BILA|nr:unnamed protein product [Gongylonema pulchrum]